MRHPTRTPIRHSRPWCCYSRLGKAKASYGTLEEAHKALEWAEKQYGETLEVYSCQVNNGRWHVRKARARDEE